MAAVSSPPEQRIVLQGVAWETYERLSADQVESSAPRFAYDRGELEILRPSADHEIVNRTLALLVELVASEMEIEVIDVGSMTFERQDLQRGFEPDSSFYVQSAEQVWGKTQIDLTVDPPPDLVIEIEITRPAVAKMPIFAAIGIPEVWRWDGAQLSILQLAAAEYRNTRAGRALRLLTSDDLTAFVTESFTLRRTAWMRRVREWARERTSSL